MIISLIAGGTLVAGVTGVILDLVVGNFFGASVCAVVAAVSSLRFA